MSIFYTTSYAGSELPEFVYHYKRKAKDSDVSKNIDGLSPTGIEGKIERLLDDIEGVLRTYRPNIFTYRKQSS